MIRNYFKTAWRNLVRNKAFSAINIMGLALGLACSLLIMLWVQDERSVDGFHKNSKQLFQVYERNHADGKITAGYATQGLLADELKKVVPEIQYASSFDYASGSGVCTFTANDKSIKMPGFFAGSDFFNMFSYPLLQGQAATALHTPNAIAISRKMAELFFESASNAIGKTIRFENKEDLQVTAVFDNLPARSSMQFDFLRSWTAYVQANKWVHNWGNASPSTYVQLRPDADPVKTEAKVKDFIYRYTTKDNRFIMELGFQPYAEKYLHGSFTNGYPDGGGRIEYVRLFSLVAIFILLIACINFMNLATARATQRAKEVGVRKVVGAGRSMLIGQFIGEALLITGIAVVVALLIAAWLLPVFNNLSGKQLVMPVAQPVFWISLLVLLVVTGLVAGSYPALFLSSLKPVRVLKGSLRFSKSATFFRKGLVVAQFTLSIVLIVGMIVIYRQVDYVQSKNLGYDRENLVYIPLEGDLVNKYSLLKDQATKMPGILAMSKMRNSPTHIEHHTGSIDWENKDPNLVASFADAVVGYDFIKTMKLQLKEGRDFGREFGTDSLSFILNETAVQKIGYQNPVGRSITWGNRRGTIIGVLKDFHFNSMHEAIEPLIIRVDENWTWGTILVRIKAGETKQAITALEKICKSLNPTFPFTYSFSDQEYNRLYQSEQVVSKLSGYFAFLAIFISCLGLFGLAAFSAGQRTKEIGVRKVLGASVPNIIVLLSTSFLQPVVMAMLIAFPVAWYVMNGWLQDFAYQTKIEWWIFAMAGVVTIGIALLTVSFQSIKSALMNPVKSLKAE
jgi:putative ABC transport system permease protein